MEAYFKQIMYNSRYNSSGKTRTPKGYELAGKERELIQLYVATKGYCAITGARFKNQHILRPSLDRIDSTKGYVLDNVQWVTIGTNFLKGQATDAQVKEFVSEVLKTPVICVMYVCSLLVNSTKEAPNWQSTI
jgi:hypothetical protein